MDLTEGVRAAIKPFVTKTALADALGIERSAVSQWTRVPIERVLKIEELTAGAVDRHKMRPDIYGPAPKKAKRRAA